MRTLDLAALRSFVAVAEVGGITRAANLMNLTQSAVSMQMKRLEEALNVSLLDRANRKVTLTTEGEQLLSYGRRMLEMNDEVVSRLTDSDFEGEMILGVPHDIVYPFIPSVLKRFSIEFPRVRVQLLSSYTRALLEKFQSGECDFILTTEDACGEGGETLLEVPLVWAGAPNGTACKLRPLPLAFEPRCVFRVPVQKVLDDAGIPWKMAVDSESSRTIEASVSADLVVTAQLAGTTPPYVEELSKEAGLPPLPSKRINLYQSAIEGEAPRNRLVELIRQSYAGQAAHLAA